VGWAVARQLRSLFKRNGSVEAGGKIKKPIQEEYSRWALEKKSRRFGGRRRGFTGKRKTVRNHCTDQRAGKFPNFS